MYGAEKIGPQTVKIYINALFKTKISYRNQDINCGLWTAEENNRGMEYFAK